MAPAIASMSLGALVAVLAVGFPLVIPSARQCRAHPPLVHRANAPVPATITP